MPVKNTEQFIYCSQCHSTGLNKLGMLCPECGGMGLGTFQDNNFYFWGAKLGTVSIEIHRLKIKLDKIINLFFALIATIGFLSLVYWLYLSQEILNSPEATGLLKAKSPWLLIFWVSTIADLFIVYQISETTRKSFKIKHGLDAEAKKIKVDSWSDILKLPFRKKINTTYGYSETTYAMVEDAYNLASRLGSKEVMIEHLMITIMGDQQVAALFTRLNVDIRQIAEKIKKQIEQANVVSYRTEFPSLVKEVLIDGYLAAKDFKQNKVSPIHLILPMMARDPILKEIMYEFEIDENKIRNVIKWFVVDKQMVDNYYRYRNMARFKPSGNMDRAYTAVATPLLNQFSYDLTVAAKWGRLDMCVGKDKELEKIFEALEAGKNGVMLVGAPGVGKNTIVAGLAQLMVSEEVPKFLRDKRLLELDVGGLVSGGSAAESQEKLMLAVNELNRAGNIVVFINNIETIMGISAGGESSLQLSDVLANALNRGALFCIASVTSENYHKYLENKPLDNAMAKIEVEEPRGNDAIQIIESKISALEGRHKIYFSYPAIEQVVSLSQKYIHDKYLPEKAVEILNLIAVNVSKTKGEQSMVTHDDIARAISEITKIPITKLSQEENKVLLNLEDLIHNRMVDQEEAVHMVASSLRRARANLREGKRPIANLLFLGPTGVGKTELAKTVSELYFGSEDYMIRVDMSEYQLQQSVEKMIGGHGTLGYLTEKVRRAPFSLILLDEFEKAHPDILNLFLQVMDDGRLTDGMGRTIDFTNSIIIATSNAGALFIQEQIRAGAAVDSIKDTLVNEHLNKIMRPELINRFDGLIVFKPLSMNDVESITRIMLNKMTKILGEKGINFEVSEAAIKIFAQKGYDPKFGARPLRRLLQDSVDDKIANLMLNNSVKRRDTIVINDSTEIEVRKAMAL